MRLVEISEGISINPDNVVCVEDRDSYSIIWVLDDLTYTSDYNYKKTCDLLEGKNE